MLRFWDTLLPYQRNSLLFGVAVGLCLSLASFAWIPWYRALVIWGWTNPWMYVLGVPLGIAAGIYLDED